LNRKCISLSVVVSFAAVVHSALGIESARQVQAWQTMQRSFPGVRANTAGNLVLSVYGRAMDTGVTPEAAAEQFRVSKAQVFGVSSGDLQSGLVRRGGRLAQPVMYDPTTDQYKFTLFYYSQFKDGIPVFRADLRVLVRNEDNFPVVLANSSLRPLGGFEAVGRLAQADATVGMDTVRQVAPHLNRISEHGLVIWAGVDEQLAEPRLAYRIEAENDHPERWLYLVDATTGEILYSEDRIQHVDVTGTVTGNGTADAKADICSSESPLRMHYSRVNIGGTIAFADDNGNFVLSNPGTTDVTVDSPIRGEWFQVFNFQGAEESLSMTVTPPGPANFVHNTVGTEHVRAQVNGYVHANIVRDHVVKYNPLYPFMNVTDSPVYVNRTDGFCPDNAWWDPGDLSINFCSAGGSNTAFGSVIYHEYGHHLVNAAGSGQDQYGEGMGDVMSVIITDDPGTGYGFGGSCTFPLRSADNSLQYPCTAEAHSCAGLISGAVWDTRNELIITEPANYLDILSNLSINAMLVHTGSSITPQIAIDFLTLDDDNATIDDGTPHHDEICTGFGEHNLDCPPLVLLQFDYPNGLPNIIPPGAPATIRVNVVSNVVAPIESTGTVSYRIGETGAFTTEAMSEIAPNQYEAALPATECGDAIQFFFTAQADSGGGVEMNDPIDSPNSLHSAIAAIAIETVAQFNFEDTTAWTVSGNAADGQWNSGIPVNGNRGDPPSDYDGSGRCYLTDNVAGNSDVDDGTTILTSPRFDLAGMNNARVSYARWYSNVEGDSPQADTFVVRASNDQTNFTTVETVGPGGSEVVGGWFTRSFRVSDFVTPSDTVQFRFEASDLGAGSIVEAAIDAFEITNVICGIESPAVAAAPHAILKNRYISVDPRGASGLNFGQDFDIKLTLSDTQVSGVTAVGGTWWAGPPNADCVSLVTTTPPASPRNWDDCPTLHLTGCPIIPTSTYDMVIVSGGVESAPPLAAMTQAKPGDKWWGDCVGSFDTDTNTWTPPQGTTNIDDALAGIFTFQDPNALNATHLSVVDVHPVMPPGHPNQLININDVFQIILGFQGKEYAGFAIDLCP